MKRQNAFFVTAAVSAQTTERKSLTGNNSFHWLTEPLVASMMHPSSWLLTTKLQLWTANSCLGSTWCSILQNSGCAQNEVPDGKSLVGFAQLTITDETSPSSG